MNRRIKLKRMLAGMAAAALAAAVLTACGSDSGTTSKAEAPDASQANKPATGTLSVFAYDDTVTDQQLDPFRKANPDLNLKIATFDSDDEAAAKLAGGFQADVVEVCLDEAGPLTKRHLLRPLDTSGIPDWNKLSFRNNPNVRQNGKVIMAPLDAGPYGLIYNTKEVPEGIDSYNALFDPKFKGQIAMDDGEATVPLGVAALALGYDDPFNMTSDQLEKAKQKLIDNKPNVRSYADSDSSMVNLFKSGEVTVANGGRGTSQDMIDDGVPVKWVQPKEGSWAWVCGLGITSKAKNIPAAYKLINYYAGPKSQAISASNGFVITNPDAMPLVPKKWKKTASPDSLKNDIPQTEPPNVEDYTKAWQEVRTG